MLPRIFFQSQRYNVRVVDRIGGGDSFAAGLIHGFVSGRDLEATLKFAVAASALKPIERWRPRAACCLEKESS